MKRPTPVMLRSSPKTIDELVAPDAVIRTPLPIDATGAEALKQVWAMLLRIYPDIHLTVEDLIAEGDKVVGRTTVTGTHQGEFMGVAPTGKSVTYNEIFIFRFADGRVVETWGVVDVYAQMKQIGVIPARSRRVQADRYARVARHPGHQVDVVLAREQIDVRARHGRAEPIPRHGGSDASTRATPVSSPCSLRTINR